MDFERFSPLSKYNWFLKLHKSYYKYLISNNFSINKAKQLTILFGWHVELIYYQNDWDYFYPEISIDLKNKYPHKIFKNSKKNNLKKSIFYKLRNLIFKKINLVIIRIILILNSNFIRNVHLKRRWDLTRLNIIKKLIPNTEEKTVLKKNIFLDKYFSCPDKESFSENLRMILPPEFFINKISLPYSEFEINCEEFIVNKSISLLILAKGIKIINCTHGCTLGWFTDNFFDYRVKELSSKTQYWDYEKPDQITRYYIKPKNKSQKNQRVLWISRAHLNSYYYKMIPAINYESYKNINQHLETIYRVIKETKYYFVDHKKNSLKEYKLYKKYSSKIINFDPTKIYKNDIFIFDTINSSLIFYAKKYSINFLVYESIVYKNTTERFNKFRNQLLENKQLFINEEQLFKKQLFQIFSGNNISKDN